MKKNCYYIFFILIFLASCSVNRTHHVSFPHEFKSGEYFTNKVLHKDTIGNISVKNDSVFDETIASSDSTFQYIRNENNFTEEKKSETKYSFKEKIIKKIIERKIVKALKKFNNKKKEVIKERSKEFDHDNWKWDLFLGYLFFIITLILSFVILSVYVSELMLIFWLITFLLSGTFFYESFKHYGKIKKRGINFYLSLVGLVLYCLFLLTLVIAGIYLLILVVLAIRDKYGCW